MKKKNRLLILVCLSIVTLIFFAVPKTKAGIIEEDNKYYIGKYNSINNAANMIDKIDKENILISPFGINSLLASLYNVDGSLEGYFNDTIDNVNRYYLPKVSKYTYVDSNKNKEEEYYESLIEKFYNGKYNELTSSSLNKIGNITKEEIILLIIKIKLAYEAIDNSNINLKDIKKYVLTNKDKNMSNNIILSNIKDIVINNNIYRNNNYIINSSNVYSSSNIDKDILSKYYIHGYRSNLDNEEDIKIINKNTYNDSLNNTNYIVDKEVLNKDIVLTNSLVFNYKWDNIISEKSNTYEEFYYKDNILTKEMININSNNILENDEAIGFIKDYEDSKYIFLGIMLKNNNNYLSSINIERLLKSYRNTSINVAIPLFSIKDSNKYIDDNMVIASKNSFSFTNAGSMYIDTKNIEYSNYATLTNEENIVFNREFYFLIIDNLNNVVLLIGKISNPNM